MNRHIAFLLNPISGKGNRAALEPSIRKLTSASGLSYSIHDTHPRGEYPQLEEAIRRGEITDVVAAGGDGSISALCAALRHTGVRFGILPRGSGNGLAYAAGIPMALDQAIQVVIQGNAAPVDGMLINGRFSCMLSGIGFDALVAQAFAQEKKRGFWTYVKLSARHFFRAEPYPFRISVHNRQMDIEAYFISLANANQFGNRITIAPKARLDDGLLDMVIVQKMHKWQVLSAIVHQIRFGDVRERIFRKNSIVYLQANQFVIENPARAPLHIDGDPAATSDRFIVEVVPAAFRLLQPGAATRTA